MTRITTGGSPYAIGVLDKGWFRVRCIRFGKLSASYELRSGEEIRTIKIEVSEKKAKPEKID